MRLYVANASKQNQVVFFRTETKRTNPDIGGFEPAKQQEIRPGQQISLGGDYDDIETVDFVAKQLQAYGAVFVKDVGSLRDVAPLIMNVEKAVPAEIIRKVDFHNQRIKFDIGKIRRQKAAVALNDTVQSIVAEQFRQKQIDEEPTDKIDVTYEQIDVADGEKPIAEGIHVRPNTSEKRARRRK